MPASLLIAVVQWLASHLIVLTLLGFVAVGVWLFGATSPEPTVPSYDEPTAGVVAPTPKPPPANPNTSESSPSAHIVREEARAKQPKMIGGTLPMRPERPAAPAETAPSAELGRFRPDDQVPPTPTTNTATREQRFQRAREAYWRGDFEAAEMAYMDLLRALPDDADGFGELGNLYQAMGLPALARDAYYEAAVRLRAAGDSDKLAHVEKLLKEMGER